jgi:glucan phosphorylase
LPNWEPKFANKLLAASHVWVNNPRVGFEACGTSGMKAGLNLALLVSTRDGFLAEVHEDAFYAIKGASDSAEELASYYTALTLAIADARNPKDWSYNVKRLWKSNFLHITSGARMLAQYLEMALPEEDKFNT